VNIGSPVSVTFTNGVSDNTTTTTLVAYKAESTTVDVTDLSINSFGDPAYDLDLTVNAEAASRLDLTPHGGSTAPGTAFTVTVTAYDNYTNIATGYTGTVRFSSTDNATGVQLPSDYVFTTGDSGSRMFTNGVTLITVGSRSVTVTDTVNGALTDTQTWSVGAGAIDHYTVTSDSYIQQTSIAFTVTVTAYNANGNMVTSDNITPVTMGSNPDTVIFDGNGNGIFGEAGDNVKTLVSGTFNIQAKCNTVADNVTITASSGSITSSSNPYTIEEFRCFIATAAYGTPMASEIQVLRDFRDRYLVTNAPGRCFVSLYYKCSPPVARFIAHHDSLRAVVRGGLAPIIWLATIALKATMVQKLTVLCSFLITATMTVVALIWIRRTIRSKPT
jgi:hypothetical protein